MYLEPDFSLFSSNAGDSSGQKGIAMSGSSLIVWPAGLPTRRRKLIRTMAGAAVAVLVAVLGLAGAPQANAGINGTFYLAAVDNTGIIGVKEGTPTMPFTLEASGAQAAVAWDSGHGMTLAVLDANGNVTAKQNTSSWLSEMSGASQVAVTSDPGLGPTLAVVQNGTVYLKQGFIDGAFTQVWASGAKQIAIASDSVRGVLVAVLTDNGDVWAAQDFDLNGNSLWTKEFSGVQQVAVASDYSGPLIGVLSFGVALVKRGGLARRLDHGSHQRPADLRRHRQYQRPCHRHPAERHRPGQARQSGKLGQGVLRRPAARCRLWRIRWRVHRRHRHQRHPEGQARQRARGLGLPVERHRGDEPRHQHGVIDSLWAVGSATGPASRSSRLRAARSAPEITSTSTLRGQPPTRPIPPRSAPDRAPRRPR